jgi:ribosome maturation factor RimP
MSLIEDIQAVCERVGVFLYDTETIREFDENVFRIYIVSENGIDVDKCAHVSRLLSPLFDVHPPMPGEYRLEVSSPGIERNLKTPEHYHLSVGANVKLTTKEGEKLRGVLTEAHENDFVLRIDDQEIVFEYPQIKKARTYFEW